MAGNEAKPSAHFADTHERKSKLTRASSSTYRGNSTTGYTRGSWQAHHILCEHAIGSRSFEDQDFGEACLWVTDWNLNDSHNMIGMPIRADFRRENGIKDMNICSHANDHNTTGGYTEECKDFVQSNVWDKVSKGKEGHTTDPKDLSGALKATSDYFRAELGRRASRSGGTILAWTKRHEDDWADKWYRPFSMAIEGAIVPRRPGAVSDIASKMTYVFQRIK
jgi:hypothetical protein